MAVHDKLALVVAFTLTSLSTIVVALRFYCRYVLVKKLSSPDWMMLLALIATWGSTVNTYYQVKFLDYSHVVWGKIETLKPVVVGGLFTWWMHRIFYMVDQFLIKMSILLFYNQVTSSRKSFHRIVKGLMVLVVTSSFGMFMAAVFACNPPADSWDFDVFMGGGVGRYATQCYHPKYLWLFSAPFNLLTDCVIWLLPIPFVLNLQSMHIRRRLELASIFSIGIVAIAASAVRLSIVIEWLSSWEKQGLETGNLMIWTQVEQHSGIIAASIPFLRPLARIALGRRRRQQQSPTPAANLIQVRPFAHRTPIIPSPSPTFGSENSPFKGPPSPLSPIAPVHSDIPSPGSAI